MTDTDFTDIETDPGMSEVVAVLVLIAESLDRIARALDAAAYQKADR